MNRKSVIWGYFEPDDEGLVATCNACQKRCSFRTTTTNLKKHMSRVHPNITLEPREHKSPFQLKSPKPSVVASSTPQSEPEPPRKKKVTGGEKKRMTDNFLKLFYLDLQPFAITDDRGFRDFVQLLNPRFDIPTRETLSETLIPALYADCLRLSQEAAGNIKSICLTTDSWTTINNESIIAVTGHFIDDDFKFKRILLKCSSTDERHTADNLADDLSCVIADWNLINKVALVVTDNTCNIVSAVKDKLQLPHFGCFGHTINLIVKDALAQSPSATLLITKVKDLVTLFRRSTVVLNNLIDCQQNLGWEPKEILLDEETRWTSTYDMLQRFVELEEAICSVVWLLDSTVEHLNSLEWIALKDLLKVLAPFEAVTKCTTGDKHMTASMVIVVTNGLLDVCSTLSNSDLNDTANLVLAKLLGGVVSRLGNVEMNKTLSCATFIDPRMKTHAFKSSVAAKAARANVVSLVAAEISKTHERNSLPVEHQEPDQVGFSIFSSFAKKVAQESQGDAADTSRANLEVERYMEDEFLGIEEDPAAWWGNNWKKYPNLSKVVQGKFGAVATSVPCERLFSKEINVLNERRTRLNAIEVSQLMFLGENCEFLNVD